MAGQTVSTHVDQELESRFRDTAKSENRPRSQILGLALRSFLDLAPGSRQALYAIDGSATPDEQDFVARHLSRQVLRAYQTVLENRHIGVGDKASSSAGSNAEPMTEEEVEAEATRACRV